MIGNSKITVIGGAGFVGTHLCQNLAERQISFEILDLKISKRFPDKSKIADVRDISSLRQKISGDIVVNLAAVHRDDVKDLAEYYETNVRGTENVAVVCAEKCIRKIIFTSSVAVYGFAEQGADENGRIAPFNEYGRTKYLAEEILREWNENGDRKLTIVRPTVIFGEGNRGNVFNLFTQIASGKFVMVGQGKNKKSMAYIGNIAAFIEYCLEIDNKYLLCNYVDSPDMDMNALVGQVRKKLTNADGIGLRIPKWIGLMLGYIADGFTRVTGRKLPISSVRVKKFCASTSFSSVRKERIDFRPPFSLQDGIDRTLQCEFIDPDPDREIFYTE